MIRNTVSVDIGYSTNMMTFLDPMVTGDLDIVQYKSSLAVYEFLANTKRGKMDSSNIDSYPITGGTGFLLSASGSVANAKIVHVEREDGSFDMYYDYLYTVCTPPSVPPVPVPLPVPPAASKSPKRGKRQGSSSQETTNPE